MTIVESIGKWGVVHTDNPRRYYTPKSGDIVDFAEVQGKYPYDYRWGRIWQVNGDVVSICCQLGSAFLNQDGSVSISGGPFAFVPLARLQPAYALHFADYWNWGNNSPGADKGVDYRIERPVFRLMKEGGKSE